MNDWYFLPKESLSVRPLKKIDGTKQKQFLECTAPWKTLKKLKGLIMKIHNLCNLEEGVISGPLSPMMFAQDVMEQLQIRFDGLCRVCFDDNLLQAKDEPTGYDTVMVLSEYENIFILTMLLDMGAGGFPIAYFEQKENKVVFSEIYQEEQNLFKPKNKEIKEVFNLILNDMSLIRPVEKD